MIRPIQPGDRACVVALLRATGNFNPAEVAIAEELMDIMATRPEQKDYFGFVNADASGEIAGFLVIGPTPATVGAWHMYWIAVPPRCYGTGVAQVLDNFAADFVRERGGYWLIAETSGQPGYA